MTELKLVGLADDGERLVLAAPAGDRFTVRIDDALRAAVRRDRPQLEQLRSQADGALSVREIQARVRAGASAEEVAASGGVSVEHVRRYEGPVLAEREHVVRLARAARVGGDEGATLDELVAQRLAVRGVEADDARWDAAKEAGGPWRVIVRFDAGGGTREAVWRRDAGARAVEALDDEARWLSEPEPDDDPFVGGPVTGMLRAVPEPDTDLLTRTTHAILDDLGRRRGRRGDDGTGAEGHGYDVHPWEALDGREPGGATHSTGDTGGSGGSGSRGPLGVRTGVADPDEGADDGPDGLIDREPGRAPDEEPGRSGGDTLPPGRTGAHPAGTDRRGQWHPSDEGRGARPPRGRGRRQRRRMPTAAEASEAPTTTTSFAAVVALPVPAALRDGAGVEGAADGHGADGPGTLSGPDARAGDAQGSDALSSGVPGSGVPGSGAPGSGVPGSGVPGPGAQGHDDAVPADDPGTDGSSVPGSSVPDAPDPSRSRTARGKRARPGVPSWDEILFGSRSDA